MTRGNKLGSVLDRMERVVDSIGLATLHDPAEMAHILEREVCRADRSHSEFCLLLFSTQRANGEGPGAKQIVDCLKHRARGTDELGWYDKQYIGIVLPDTSIHGALKLAQDVESAIAMAEPPLIYSYPSLWTNNGKTSNFGQEASPRKARMTGHTEEATGSNAPDPALRFGVPRSGVESSVADSAWRKREPLPLETLMLKPLSFWHRLADIVICAVALTLLFPLLLAVAIAIKVTSRGPVFFVQERTGLGLRRFNMYKFRTMFTGADQLVDEVQHLNEMTGPLIKIDHDPRLSRIGGFLRTTSIDELPQLFNVLKGDMTIIGPRALSPLPSQYEMWQLRRFTVSPGVACAWQAEHREERSFEDWMRSDLRYVNHSSLFIDLRILFGSIKTVIRRTGM